MYMYMYMYMYIYIHIYKYIYGGSGKACGWGAEACGELRMSGNPANISDRESFVLS